ncbi:MAG: DUF4838 domain-containing protein [Armatimonadetes bacterium]|nr:DUF4838 domain-containing protein [Armatimonadota bacterium]
MASRTKMVIQPLGFEQPVATAAAELARYLLAVGNVSAVLLRPLGSLPRQSPARIVLGTSAHLKGLGLGRLPKPNEVDDSLAIVPKNGALYLTGSNPRSVLFAAYRLLEELGVVFLRPGPGGELVPRVRQLELPTRAIREAASYRHRGICIEGYPRLEHVLGILDWMAKKKMNAFQLQFLHGGVFWRRGYLESPEAPPTLGGKSLPDADCEALDDRVISRVKELGMMLHRVGHGWTAAAVGLPGFGWDRTEQRPPEDKLGWLAEVKGKREVWRGIAANTELCYSQPQVREAFIEGVIRYARRHSEVDYLHVWMSDSYNNKCECADCRKVSPTDWYITLIDAIGRRLKEEGLATRLVFLGYFDTLWPPDTARLTTDNVTFMYAPITRCFRHALDDPKCDAGESAARPPLNQVRLPETNRAHADIMRQWRDGGVKDTFLFDYHNIWAVWRDGLGQDVAGVLAKDMKDLVGLGLDGFMSCQAIRAFFPTPYLALAMADLLWDRRLSLKPHRQAVMEASFGPHAAEVAEYLTTLVKTIQVGSGYAHRNLTDSGIGAREQLVALASYAKKHATRFCSLAQKAKSDVVRTSLEIALLQADQTARIARARLAALDKDVAAIRALRAEYEGVLAALLDRYSQWIDPLFGRAMWQVLDEAEEAARPA